MAQSTRRDFLKTGVAATVLSGIGGAATLAQTTKRSATDWVTLGKSNVKVTRLAFGTGTFSGRVQRELGVGGMGGVLARALLGGHHAQLGLHLRGVQAGLVCRGER